MEAYEEETIEEEVIRRTRRKQTSKSHHLLLAFFLPVILMVLIFIQRGIFPFGEQSFLRTDMYHQYAPFFSEFQYKLRHGASLLYSWDIGMGVNFSALYAYYLASPLNWLLLLCPKALIIEFMTYMIVIKTGLCSLTFAWYLKKHCGRDEFGIVLFSVFYALSGYMAAYSWNIMWLDCIWLFPIIIYGLERLVREGKGGIYCIALGLSILSNYYISIMICIFMILYFIAMMIIEKVSFMGLLKKSGKFTLYSLIAGGLSAGVLLPEIYALQMTASGEFNFPKALTSYFSIFDIIARHIPNVETETGLDHWPNIYCGIAVFIFMILYAVCKQINVREKAVYCAMILFFYASFAWNMLNFIWHGFHFPNSLPCRQSFIYIFLILVMCYKAYINRKNYAWRTVVTAFLCSVCFMILAEKLVDNKAFHFAVYYVAIIYLSCYMGLLYLERRTGAGIGIVKWLALALVSIEAIFNTAVTSVSITSRTAYLRDNKTVIALVKSVKEDQDFFRFEKVDRKTKNDGAWMNFPSVSLFSSTTNADLTDFFKKIGCEGNTNAYSINGSTPFADMLFSIKYGIYSSEQTNDNLKLIKQIDDTYLYENKYTLPVAFMVSSDLNKDWNRDRGNPAEVQNDFCHVIGADAVLDEVEGRENGNRFSFIPYVDGDYYVFIGNRKVEKVKVKNGDLQKTFDNVNRGFFVTINNCKSGEEITIETDGSDQSLNASAYRFDYDALNTVYTTLNRYPMEITKWKDASMEGQIVSEQDGVLFTSIPYDKGWKVKVDGKTADTEKIFDSFLSIRLDKGEHTISFQYIPEGLYSGMLISAISIVMLAALEVLNSRKSKGNLRKIEITE